MYDGLQIYVHLNVHMFEYNRVLHKYTFSEMWRYLVAESWHSTKKLQFGWYLVVPPKVWKSALKKCQSRKAARYLLERVSTCYSRAKLPQTFLKKRLPWLLSRLTNQPTAHARRWLHSEFRPGPFHPPKWMWVLF